MFVHHDMGVLNLFFVLNLLLDLPGEKHETKKTMRLNQNIKRNTRNIRKKENVPKMIKHQRNDADTLTFVFPMTWACFHFLIYLIDLCLAVF